jgi:hypothetical protein
MLKREDFVVEKAVHVNQVDLQGGRAGSGFGGALEPLLAHDNVARQPARQVEFAAGGER